MRCSALRSSYARTHCCDPPPPAPGPPRARLTAPAAPAAAACELVHSSVSLAYAVGLLPLDNNTGYAMPGGVYEGGIIPSLMAVVPAQAAMDQQRAALEAYHTLPSPVAAAIGATSTQILFVG